ncbi:hypothetical protein MTO96_028870 [Rhipicephalus appendiculatus]
MSHGDDPDASAIMPWMGQLDLDRPCGAVSSSETCWLCEDFPAWNTVIHALDMELDETAPGTLRLRFDHFPPKRDLVTTAREASVVASSLLSHHLCIQEVHFECAISTNTPASQPSFPIFMRRHSSSPASRTLRLLRFAESCCFNRLSPTSAGAHLDLRDMDAIIGLETLYIQVGRFGQRFAAELDALLERNRSTLSSVEIFEAVPGLYKLGMVEHLAACKFLELKSYSHVTSTPDVDGMVSLLRVSTTLKEATVKPITPRQVLLIAETLETNCCLTKLSLHLKTPDSIEELFGALEINKHLKELSVEVCGLNRSCMRAVASALKNNDCLETLCMNPYSFPEERLWLVSCSKTSLTTECSWDAGPEPYLRVLAPVLASLEACTRELELSDICELSHDSVSALFTALASSKKVTYLKMVVIREPDHRVALLCETLKKNRSIEFLSINICNGNSANEIIRALAVNKAITQLELSLHVGGIYETVAVFCDMLSRNSSLTSVSFDFGISDPSLLLKEFAEGLSVNRLIVSLGYSVPSITHIPPALFVPVRRNRAALNRAMEFVLERREDRHCAECFELFFGRSCMITNLVKICEMSDAEARSGVASAENRRREKYLVLTGVVQRSVVCWLADVTQIDELNWDCWRAIASYLKVTDICS